MTDTPTPQPLPTPEEHLESLDIAVGGMAYETATDILAGCTDPRIPDTLFAQLLIREGWGLLDANAARNSACLAVMASRDAGGEAERCK